MKKIILLISLICNYLLTIAQNPQIEQAKNNFQKAQSQMQNNNLDSALNNFTLAANLFKKNSSVNNYLISNLYINQILYHKAENQQALKNITNDIDTYFKYNTDTSKILIEFFSLAGKINFSLAEYNKSLEFFNKEISACKKVFSQNNIRTAHAYNSAANAYSIIGDLESAENYYLQSLDIISKTQGADNSMIINVLGNLSIINYENSDLVKALANNLKALEIINKTGIEKSVEAIFIYSNLGQVYLAQNQNNLSLSYFLKAIKYKEEFGGKYIGEAAKDYQSIGTIYHKQNNFEKAYTYYLKALEIYENIYVKKHPVFSDIYNSLAILCVDLGNFSQAEEYYQEAINHTINTFGDKHFKLSGLETNLALLYSKKGENTQALTHFNNAIDNIKYNFGTENQRLSEIYNNLANTYLDMEDFNNSMQYFQKSIKINCPNYLHNNIMSLPEITTDNLSNNLLLNALLGKSKTLLNSYFINNDITYLNTCIETIMLCDTILSNKRKKIISEKDKFILGKKGVEIYEIGIYACYNLYKKYNDIRFIKKAFYFSEKNKSATLIDAINDSKAKNLAGIPDNLLQEEQSIKEEIAFLELSIAETYDNDKIRNLRLKLLDANTKFKNLTSKLEKNYPEYYKIKYNPEIISVKELQNVLNSESLIICYFEGEKKIFKISISKNNLDLIDINKPENYSSLINSFNKTVFSPSKNDNNEYIKSSNKLSKILYKDIENKNIKNLIIIPDGLFISTPFELLFSQEFTNNKQSYNQYPFLIKKYSISYSYSGQLLKNNLLKSNYRNKSWLGIAPIFKEDNILIKNFKLTKLEGSEFEIDTINYLMQSHNIKSDIYKGNSINEKFIKNFDFSKYDIVHIATHGSVSASKPELSALYFYPDKQNDGALYSGELFNIKLKTNLIILSACETGLGTYSEGEGLIGLTRSLLYAGANNIIVTYQKIPDYPTAVFMTEFYNYYFNNHDITISQALQAAKLKMLKSEKLNLPYFWGSFILIGN